MANSKWIRIAILIVGLALYPICGYGWVHGPLKLNIDLSGPSGGGIHEYRAPSDARGQ